MDSLKLDKKINKLQNKLNELLVKRENLHKSGYTNEEVFLMSVKGYGLNKDMKWIKINKEKNIREFIYGKLS